MKQTVFTEKQVDISAFVGGLIPAGFLIYKNYKALDKEKEAYRTLAVTLIVTIGLFYGLMQLPEAIMDKIPSMAFSVFYGALIFLFFRYFMAKQVEEALENGAKKGSKWTVAGVTILGFLLNLALIFGMAYHQPFYEGEMIEVHGNQLFYDSERVSKENADLLVEILTVNEYFGAESGNIARLQSYDNQFLVTLLVDESLWSEDEIVQYLVEVKEIISGAFGSPINMQLEHLDISGTSKFKKI